MKNILLHAILCLISFCSFAQVKFNIRIPINLQENDFYIFRKVGTGEELVGKATTKSTELRFSLPSTQGIYVLSSPAAKIEQHFLNVGLPIDAQIQNNNKVSFSDSANQEFSKLMAAKVKSVKVLPLLEEIKPVYQKTDSFYLALENEISEIKKQNNQPITHDFSKKFFLMYDKFLLAEDSSVSPSEYLELFSNAGAELEYSGLMQPLLLEYLKSGKEGSTGEKADTLLKNVGITSGRGQNILSGLLEIFSSNHLDSLYEKYLKEAGSLTCEIVPSLEEKLNQHAATEIGAQFADYTFQSIKNSKEKSLYAIQAKHKIVFFWSSQCSHCKKQLPEMIKAYNTLKQNNIEIIGISLDTNPKDLSEVASTLPWRNDSEYLGWRSESVKKYGILGTPTFFILDKNNKITAKPDSFTQALEILK